MYLLTESLLIKKLFSWKQKNTTFEPCKESIHTTWPENPCMHMHVEGARSKKLDLDLCFAHALASWLIHRRSKLVSIQTLFFPCGKRASWRSAGDKMKTTIGLEPRYYIPYHFMSSYIKSPLCTKSWRILILKGTHEISIFFWKH
jgi:hypothetical protein